jgi:hypothetical protein
MRERERERFMERSGFKDEKILRPAFSSMNGKSGKERATDDIDDIVRLEQREREKPLARAYTTGCKIGRSSDYLPT